MRQQWVWAGVCILVIVLSLSAAGAVLWLNTQPGPDAGPDAPAVQPAAPEAPTPVAGNGPQPQAQAPVPAPTPDAARAPAAEAPPAPAPDTGQAGNGAAAPDMPVDPDAWSGGSETFAKDGFAFVIHDAAAQWDWEWQLPRSARGRRRPVATLGRGVPDPRAAGLRHLPGCGRTPDRDVRRLGDGRDVERRMQYPSNDTHAFDVLTPYEGNQWVYEGSHMNDRMRNDLTQVAALARGYAVDPEVLYGVVPDGLSVGMGECFPRGPRQVACFVVPVWVSDPEAEFGYGPLAGGFVPQVHAARLGKRDLRPGRATGPPTPFFQNLWDAEAAGYAESGSSGPKSTSSGPSSWVRSTWSCGPPGSPGRWDACRTCDVLRGPGGGGWSWSRWPRRSCCGWALIWLTTPERVPATARPAIIRKGDGPRPTPTPTPPTCGIGLVPVLTYPTPDSSTPRYRDDDDNRSSRRWLQWFCVTPTPTATPVGTPTPPQCWPKVPVRGPNNNPYWACGTATPTVTPTPTPTAKPLPATLDCVIDGDGNAWLPLDVADYTNRVLLWRSASGASSPWANPHPHENSVLLVSQRTDGHTQDIVAWCPDNVSRTGTGIECLMTAGRHWTRIWPFGHRQGAACQTHDGAWASSLHPSDHGGGDRVRTQGITYDTCTDETNLYAFRAGTGACRWVAPTPTPTATATPTPVCPTDQHTHGNTACHPDNYCVPHGNQPAPPHAKCPPPPTATPTPISLAPFLPPDHGAGLALHGAGDEFNPDPLAQQGLWISAAAGDALEAGHACPAAGSWLAADPWVQGWTFNPPSPRCPDWAGPLPPPSSWTLRNRPASLPVRLPATPPP